MLPKSGHWILHCWLKRRSRASRSASDVQCGVGCEAGTLPCGLKAEHFELQASASKTAQLQTRRQDAPGVQQQNPVHAVQTRTCTFSPSAYFNSILIGSLPGDSTKISGVIALLSLKQRSMSSGGGSTKRGPIVAFTNSVMAVVSLSGRSTRSSSRRWKESSFEDQGLGSGAETGSAAS